MQERQDPHDKPHRTRSSKGGAGFSDRFRVRASPAIRCALIIAFIAVALGLRYLFSPETFRDWTWEEALLVTWATALLLAGATAFDSRRRSHRHPLAIPNTRRFAGFSVSVMLGAAATVAWVVSSAYQGLYGAFVVLVCSLEAIFCTATAVRYLNRSMIEPGLRWGAAAVALLLWAYAIVHTTLE